MTHHCEHSRSAPKDLGSYIYSFLAHLFYLIATHPCPPLKKKKKLCTTWTIISNGMKILILNLVFTMLRLHQKSYDI